MTDADPAARPPGGGASGAAATGDLTIRGFQHAIEAAFLERDRRRGTAGTFLWFVEEVGELARAIKRGEPANLEEEFGDVLAWLSTLASLSGVDLARAAGAYRDGCPTCRTSPCTCPFRPLAV